MKKLFIIIVLCIFAGITKCYAGSWGWNFDWNYMTNECVCIPSSENTMNGSNATVVVDAYAYTAGGGWGYNIQMMDSQYNILGSLIDGPYNGVPNSNNYSSKSISFSGTFPFYFYIRTCYVTGWVGIFW